MTASRFPTWPHSGHLMDPSTVPLATFDRLFASSSDPWRFKDRWYEARKRALTLACLPRARYRSGYEPGCANGELSAALAERCDRLLVADCTTAAVELARQRVAEQPHVRVERALLPQDWPQEVFDLIVISEIAYYLTAPALADLAAKARGSLQAGGDIVACHWRHPIDGCPLGGDAVHGHLSRWLDLPCIWSLSDPDFVLQVWSTDTRSVGNRERLA